MTFRQIFEALTNYQQQLMRALLLGKTVYANWNGGQRNADQWRLEHRGYTKFGPTNLHGIPLRLTVEGWAIMATIVEQEQNEDQNTHEVA